MRTFTLTALAAILPISQAQAQPARGTFQSHKYDPSSDQVVSLLGENGNIPRLATKSAASCSPNLAALRASAYSQVIVDDLVNLRFQKPKELTELPIPLPAALSTTDSRMVARFASQSGRSAAQEAQAYVSIESVEGYPVILLTKESKVENVVECKFELTSGETASLVQATAVTPERGVLTYVLGYVRIGSRWVHFVASSSRLEDREALSAMFASVTTK